MTLCYYEGYIRNRRQLCRDLDLPDGTNEQAILEAAYRRWGADLVHHLYGAFAFAFHDKNDNSYFCARDQIGVQPFFYYQAGNNTLLFSGDVNEILRDPRFHPALDMEALQGRIVGLDIVKNAGDLGAGNRVRLRGTGAMSSSDGDASPLIVLNGKILHLKLDDEVWMHATKDEFQKILHLDNQTVESIRVLKDAAATAVYGSQGWNGVLEITTKPIKTLPDSLIAKVKAYEKKSDPKILVGRDHGKVDMSKFEGKVFMEVMEDLPTEQTTYVVPISRIAPIIKQKRAKKQQVNSITFKVDENLKALDKTVVAHYDGRLAAQYLLGQDGVKVDDQHVVAMSFADAQNLRIVVKDAFFQCMVKAYAEHKSVTLSPDMMWLLISQGFARYVNAHSEELRPLLVSHEGKMDLAIESPKDLLSEDINAFKLFNIRCICHDFASLDNMLFFQLVNDDRSALCRISRYKLLACTLSDLIRSLCDLCR